MTHPKVQAMRVLVTGASGRVGRRLVTALQSDGHWIRGFDVIPPPFDPTLDDLALGALHDLEALAGAIEGMDAVIHLAAFMSWLPSDEGRLFETNVRGTHDLADLAARHGVKRLVFASSGEVYPELAPVRLPIDESHPTLPTSAYGTSKLLGEEIVRAYGRRSGLETCILRFAHTQSPEELLDPNSFFSGPRFYVNAKLRQLRKLPASPAVARSIEALEAVATSEERHYIGCSADGLPYRMGICDVRDMVHGLQLALTQPAAAGETFNIGPAESFDFGRAVPYLARATGLSTVTVPLHTTAYHYDTSVDKARTVIGYTPRHSIFDMIDAAIQWRDARPGEEAAR